MRGIYRRPAFLAALGLLFGSLVARAYDTSWIASGQALSSTQLRGNLDEIQMRLAQLESLPAVPAGTIVAFGGPVAPSGWLRCDGSAQSRTGATAPLFAAIGESWGHGDGATTFNLPDLRGRFLRGVDSGSGNDPDRASRTAVNGGNSGDNVGSLQGSQFAAHTHYISTWGSTCYASGAINPDRPASASTCPLTSVGSTPATSSAGGSSETRPVNAYVIYIIKM